MDLDLQFSDLGSCGLGVLREFLDFGKPGMENRNGEPGLQQLSSLFIQQLRGRSSVVSVRDDVNSLVVIII